MAEDNPAKWMEGNWGVRFLLPATGNGKKLDQFNVENVMQQLRPLKSTCKWVQINASQGANGAYYTTP
eukprot:5204040-Ditylum_brightwellii.AAC.1